MAAYFEGEATGVCEVNKNFVLCNKSKAGGSGKLKYMPSGTLISPQELLELMISESDNTAANMLIDSFGFEYLNAAFKRFGLRGTNLERKMMDFKDGKNGVENYTMPRIWRFCCARYISGAWSIGALRKDAWIFLKKQKINDRIPALLPQGLLLPIRPALSTGCAMMPGSCILPGEIFLSACWSSTTTRLRALRKG